MCRSFSTSVPEDQDFKEVICSIKWGDIRMKCNVFFFGRWSIWSETQNWSSSCWYGFSRRFVPRLYCSEATFDEFVSVEISLMNPCLHPFHEDGKAILQCSITIGTSANFISYSGPHLRSSTSSSNSFRQPVLIALIAIGLAVLVWYGRKKQKILYAQGVRAPPNVTLSTLVT